MKNCLFCIAAPLLLPTLSMAQSAAPVAFELAIQAPDDIRELLERHLELLRYREVSDLSDTELERLLTTAEQDTRELVATLGYFSPRITFEQQARQDGQAAGTPRRLTLTVDPGAATVVTEVAIRFSGAALSDPQAATQRQLIENQWALPSGTRFTQARWAQAKQQALLQLSAQRYPSAQLSEALADIDPVSHQARLSITLDSGPAYQMGPLVIQGLVRYDAELVERLAQLEPGASFDRAQLVAAQQRLTDSGYFDSAFLSLDTTGEPARAPVQVQLHEARLQKLVLGIGASTDGGARLSFEHTHHKVPGIHWRAVSKLLLNRESSSIETELTSPPDKNHWAWVTAAQLQTQSVGSFDVNSQMLRAGRGQAEAQRDRNYYLQYDRADTASSNAAASSIAETLSANYALTLRRFDSIPFPTKGWGLGLVLGGGATLGTQQYPYARVLARGRAYIPLGVRTDDHLSSLRAGRLMLRGEVGTVLARDGTSLPSTHLFLIGGDAGVRGYGYHELGVKLPNGQTTAGRYMTQGTLEWQHPIVRNGQLTRWESTAFIDAGDVADQTANLRAKVGVGMGLRWMSPVGPLQMDVAYGVDVNRWRLHLNVGFNF